MTKKRVLHLFILPVLAIGVGVVLTLLAAMLIALTLGAQGIEALADLTVLNLRGLDIFRAEPILRLFLNTVIYISGGVGVLGSLVWLFLTGVYRPAIPAALNKASVWWWVILALSGMATVGIAFWIWTVQPTVRRDLNLLIIGPALLGTLLLYWLLTFLFTRAALAGQLPLAGLLPTRWRKW